MVENLSSRFRPENVIHSFQILADPSVVTACGLHCHIGTHEVMKGFFFVWLYHLNSEIYLPASICQTSPTMSLWNRPLCTPLWVWQCDLMLSNELWQSWWPFTQGIGSHHRFLLFLTHWEILCWSWSCLARRDDATEMHGHGRASPGSKRNVLWEPVRKGGH